MRQHKEVYAVKELCRVLSVSESGYYRWLKNREKPSARKLLSAKILEILSEHTDNDSYGVDRMRLALRCRGVAVSRATVYCAMKESGLLHKRHRPHGITKVDNAVQEEEKLIKRDIAAHGPA